MRASPALNQDALSCPKGVRNRGVLLYFLTNIGRGIIKYVTRFGKRDLFDKKIILINKQLKMPYIYETIENGMLVIFYGVTDLIFPFNCTVS